jgi:hypothetical protein
LTNEISTLSSSKPSAKHSGHQSDGISWRNFGEIFDWLYKHGVRKIVKITVVDDEDNPHSDELIETALQRLCEGEGEQGKRQITTASAVKVNLSYPN